MYIYIYILYIQYIISIRVTSRQENGLRGPEHASAFYKAKQKIGKDYPRRNFKGYLFVDSHPGHSSLYKLDNPNPSFVSRGIKDFCVDNFVFHT